MKARLELIDDLYPQTRREYKAGILLENDLTQNPLDLFKGWLDEAFKSSNPEPNAFSLSTVSNNKPYSRMLLLKAFKGESLVFFTNYQSSKAQQLEENSAATMLFFWPELMRQVRIEGLVGKLDSALNDSYFATRPENARIGAHVSKQSKLLTDRQILDRNYQEETIKFVGQEIPRPESWGGYRFLPEYYEFWQGRESRLHDRLIYSKKGNIWTTHRLYP